MNTPIKCDDQSDMNNFNQPIDDEKALIENRENLECMNKYTPIILDNLNQSIKEEEFVSNCPNDDISIDLRKTGGGSGRSVKLELRELLDLVLSASGSSTTNSLELSSPALLNVLIGSGKLVSSVQRPPIGLVTQLLWRTRALDDRGPWILTFSMWWLVQHYFGIGSRIHHVKLRWGHLRLIKDTIDPVTGLHCDAIEYIGPMEFSTSKARSMLFESVSETDSIDSKCYYRRVYPSSGWAEAEIVVASVLSSDRVEDRPRVRPLDTDASIPGVSPRAGPDFVQLYKQFSKHRHRSTMTSNSPFYVQPLQVSLDCFF